MITRIVQVTVPRLVSDNPMALFKTFDDSWEVSIPITSPLIQFLAGRHEAWFEIVSDSQKIISMKQVEEKVYLASSVKKDD